MLDLSLFRVPTFVGASIAPSGSRPRCSRCSCTSRCTSRTCLHYSPLQAGLRFLPITLTSFVVAPISGRLSSTVPIRVLLGLGLLLVSARAAAHARPHRAARGGPTCWPGSSWPGSASAWSTRRWPRPPSGWCRRSARAWPRASTRPSGRWASRPGSPPWAPSSSRRSRTRSRAAWPRWCTGARRPWPTWSSTRRSPGALAQVAGASRGVAGGLVQSSFIEALNDILLIGSIVALVAAVLTFLRLVASPSATRPPPPRRTEHGLRSSPFAKIPERTEPLGRQRHRGVTRASTGIRKFRRNRRRLTASGVLGALLPASPASLPPPPHAGSTRLADTH